MDIESFREYCLSLPGTTEGMKWEHLCFMIEEKIFVIATLDNGNSFSIKVNPEDFDELVARDGIMQAPHLARRQWIRVSDLNVFSLKELQERVKRSRDLVLAKLPKKIQEKYKIS